MCQYRDTDTNTKAEGEADAGGQLVASLLHGLQVPRPMRIDLPACGTQCMHPVWWMALSRGGKKLRSGQVLDAIELSGASDKDSQLHGSA